MRVLLKKKCKCGCNTIVKQKRKGKYNSFIYGHSEKYKNKMIRFKSNCKCGCKKETKWNDILRRYNYYLDGHENKGRILSEGHKEKIRIGNIGKKMSKEAIEKTRIFHIGSKRSTEVKRRMSIAMKGRVISQKQRLEHSKRMLGRKYTQEHKDKISKAQSGEKGNNWQGGIAKLPYLAEFNKKLKNFIRKRDNYCCRLCRIREVVCKKKLNVHHIDYNKKNNIPDNPISLCTPCHGKTHFNRDGWIRLFNYDFVNRILRSA